MALPTSILILLCIGATVIVGLLAWGLTLRHANTRLSGEVRDIKTGMAALRREMERDTLTEAMSRNHMLNLVDGKPRTKDCVVLWIDLDDLGSVNDGHGYSVSDALLQAIARTLMKTVGEAGLVGRLGGDEFCIVLKSGDMEAAEQIARDVAAAITKTKVPSGDQMVSRSASIGVAPLRPDQRLVDAIIVAEDAMMLAKEEGRNRVQVANAQVLESRAQRTSKPTLEELQVGLDRDEVTYFVQPIWDIEIGKPVGVEALIRWITPEGEVRLPERFIDTMTSSYHLELKPPLGAANYAAQAFTKNDSEFFCTFNISNRFLKHSHDLRPDWVNDLLFGVPPRQMVFEIVESAVIQDPEGAKRLFTTLQNAGVRVALDDFGTGFSNLERLRDYPVDIVKIDRLFITNTDDITRNTAILQGLVEMSKTMGFEIIAEGIETEAQLEKVRAAGIKWVQGYLLGRPGPVDDWVERLK